MPVTNEHRVARPHDNEIVDAEERDTGAAFVENDVVTRLECGHLTVRGVASAILFEIARDRLPATNIIPIKFGFHHEHAIGVFH